MGIQLSVMQEPENGRTEPVVELTKKDIEQILEGGTLLGKGGTCVVKKGVWNGKEVAVKALYMGSKADEFEKEVRAMCSLRHPALLGLDAICVEADSFSIITEYISLGTLSNYLHGTKGELSSTCDLETMEWVISDYLILCSRILSDVSAAMAYIHSCDYIHRDLKPANVLIYSLNPNAPVTAKVCDLGASRELDFLMTTNVGTFPYMAPEMFDHETYTTAIDVYSYGIMLWEVLARREPYLELKSINQIVMHVTSGKRCTIPKSTPAAVQKLITDCWEGKAVHRPTFNDIHQRFKELLQSDPLSIEAAKVEEEIVSKNMKGLHLEGGLMMQKIPNRSRAGTGPSGTPPPLLSVMGATSPIPSSPSSSAPGVTVTVSPSPNKALSQAAPAAPAQTAPTGGSSILSVILSPIQQRRGSK